jgi:hypothetical protein
MLAVEFSSQPKKKMTKQNYKPTPLLPEIKHKTSGNISDTFYSSLIKVCPIKKGKISIFVIIFFSLGLNHSTTLIHL